MEMNIQIRSLFAGSLSWLYFYQCSSKRLSDRRAKQRVHIIHICVVSIVLHCFIQSTCLQNKKLRNSMSGSSAVESRRRKEWNVKVFIYTTAAE